MQVQLLDSNSWPQHQPEQRRSSSGQHNTSTPTHANPSVATSTPAATAHNRTEQLFNELQRLIVDSGASTPHREYRDELLDYPPVGFFGGSIERSGKMPPKKSGRAMLREEGALHLQMHHT